MKNLSIFSLLFTAACLLVCSPVSAVEPVAVTASSHDGNGPDNTLDNNLDTRWSALGGGQWIRFDLGQTMEVQDVSVAFFKGNARSADFEIQVSTNGSSWNTLWSGTQPSSTLSLQRINVSDTAARYVRIVGYGNTVNSWNSITEVEITAANIDDGDDLNVTSVTASAHDGNVPANTRDNNLGSRWSALGNGQWIRFDLGGYYYIDDFQLAFFKGDQRFANFDIELSDNASSWVTYFSGSQQQSTTALQSINLNGPSSRPSARYIRFVGYGNTSNNWNSLTEAKVFGAPAGGPIPTPTITPTPTLDPNKPPSENFDLKDWYLSVPTDENDNGFADSIKGSDLDDYEHPEYFYTGEDGGMVFRCPIGGFKTSNNTSFTRVELREMLSRGSNSNTKDLENNWVFSTAPSSMRSQAGGIDGFLRATVAVNRVTTTGLAKEHGRVVIGQIHAPLDEPLKLYYRKTNSNSLGTIYMTHEPEREVGGEDEVEIFYGNSTTSGMPNPTEGIALNEKFTYEVRVVGNNLSVTIIRDGRPDITRSIDMSGNGYDVDGQYMYFKAGLYNQNQSGDADDYAEVTFYELENTHTGYNP